MKLFNQLITALFFSLISTSAVFAHGETVVQALGKTTTGAAATDIWKITCTKGPDKKGGPIVTPTRLTFHVMDLAPVHPAVISVQAFKGTLKSPVYKDPKDGDKVYGPAGFASLKGGQGDYYLKITKSASTVKGVEKYIPQFHCWSDSSTGKNHSTISFRLIQNQ
ncbi:hypothetical protein [Methyloglobulus sp.]|uniref:hypothetical protein n=1 Tax=Methyloglobulus sp. TaxID=2518622 RepID=UPI0032B82AED